MAVSWAGELHVRTGERVSWGQTQGGKRATEQSAYYAYRRIIILKFYFSDLGELLTSKLRIVVTFMALLEMLKNGEIDIHQSGPFSKMKILKAA